MPHPRAQSAAIAVTAVAAVGMLAGCGHSGASAVTTLTDARNVSVISPNGSTVPGVPGLRLRRGDVVQTSADGSAILSTSGRTAYLGGTGAYTVVNGVSGVLQRGAFVADARRGPQLRVQVGPFAVRTDQSAVRIERTFAIRVGALSGRPLSITSTDRGLTVAALHQVVIAGRVLPTRTTPLVLTNDDAERRVVPDLVFDDKQLTDAAASLNQGTEGRTIVAAGQRAGLQVRISTAALQTTTPVVTTPVSEAALPVAIARAAVGDAAAVPAFRKVYDEAAQARADGGSWGVVARLAGTDATATSKAIEALLGIGGLVGPGAGPAGGTTANGNPQPGTSPAPQPGNTGNGNGSGGGNPGPSPSPTPSPSPSPSGGVVAPVQDVVDALLGILPTPRTGGPSSPPANRCKVLGLLNC
ncbi:MAG: hypothetical protein QOG53_1647 [Frankiales bacterium]|jgi:hypothetical protein|nr:hypothetical protein [Frankiales bacterium]